MRPGTLLQKRVQGVVIRISDLGAGSVLNKRLREFSSATLRQELSELRRIQIRARGGKSAADITLGIRYPCKCNNFPRFPEFCCFCVHAPIKLRSRSCEKCVQRHKSGTKRTVPTVPLPGRRRFWFRRSSAGFCRRTGSRRCGNCRPQGTKVPQGNPPGKRPSP